MPKADIKILDLLDKGQGRDVIVYAKTGPRINARIAQVSNLLIATFEIPRVFSTSSRCLQLLHGKLYKGFSAKQVQKRMNPFVAGFFHDAR